MRWSAPFVRRAQNAVLKSLKFKALNSLCNIVYLCTLLPRISIASGYREPQLLKVSKNPFILSTHTSRYKYAVTCSSPLVWYRSHPITTSNPRICRVIQGRTSCLPWSPLNAENSSWIPNERVIPYKGTRSCVGLTNQFNFSEFSFSARLRFLQLVAKYQG